MITTLFALMIINYLIGKLLVYLILKMCRIINDNAELFKKVYSQSSIDWAIRTHNYNKGIIESYAVHIPIMNIVFCIGILVMIRMSNKLIKYGRD